MRYTWCECVDVGAYYAEQTKYVHIFSALFWTAFFNPSFPHTFSVHLSQINGVYFIRLSVLLKFVAFACYTYSLVSFKFSIVALFVRLTVLRFTWIILMESRINGWLQIGVIHSLYLLESGTVVDVFHWLTFCVCVTNTNDASILAQQIQLMIIYLSTICGELRNTSNWFFNFNGLRTFSLLGMMTSSAV